MSNLLTIAAVIFFLFAIPGCKKEDDRYDLANELYYPVLKSVRGDGKVTLQWERPFCPFECPQLVPTRFEVYISNSDPSKLQLHSAVTNNIIELTIDNLINGTPYYFAIKAVGTRKKFAFSNTIMTIPGHAERIQTIFQGTGKDIQFASWSPDESAVAYVSDYLWNNGNNGAQSVFLYSLSVNREQLIEINARSPEWSPTGQQIAYHTDNGEVSTPLGRPAHIAVYNVQDSSRSRLTWGNSFNYLASWSPDGNWIAFLSDRAGGKEFNIWKVPYPNLNGTAIQVTSDFNDLPANESFDNRSPQTLSWSRDGSSIAFARLKKSKNSYDYDIFSVPANGGTVTTIVSSPWSDFCPAYSPDGTTIAFVSMRSGSKEIWTMNLATGKLRQITGSTGQPVYENAGKIEWSASGRKILFTGYAGSSLTIYTVDIN